MPAVHLSAGIKMILYMILSASPLLIPGCAAGGITSEVLKGKVEAAQKQEAALSAELTEAKERLAAVAPKINGSPNPSPPMKNNAPGPKNKSPP